MHIVIIIVVCDTFLIDSTAKHLPQECFVRCPVALFLVKILTGQKSMDYWTINTGAGTIMMASYNFNIWFKREYMQLFDDYNYARCEGT
jgi:hypothetical protein